MNKINSHYLQVKEFHEAFDLSVNVKPNKELLDKDVKTKKLRIDLIKEELDELKEAIENKDMVEVGDALADILYVTYGAGVSFGIDLDKVFDQVHESNMSKLCKSEEEAIETVEWYKKNNTIYDSPDYRPCKSNPNLWTVYNKSTGKILKSINYSPVDLKYLAVDLKYLAQ
jgi:predicted HAD superfamily Cof-like phosphohydrolase